MPAAGWVVVRGLRATGHGPQAGWWGEGYRLQATGRRLGGGALRVVGCGWVVVCEGCRLGGGERAAGYRPQAAGWGLRGGRWLGSN